MEVLAYFWDGLGGRRIVGRGIVCFAVPGTLVGLIIILGPFSFLLVLIVVHAVAYTGQDSDICIVRATADSDMVFISSLQ